MVNCNERTLLAANYKVVPDAGMRPLLYLMAPIGPVAGVIAHLKGAESLDGIWLVALFGTLIVTPVCLFAAIFSQSVAIKPYRVSFAVTETRCIISLGDTETQVRVKDIRSLTTTVTSNRKGEEIGTLTINVGGDQPAIVIHNLPNPRRAAALIRKLQDDDKAEH